MEGVRERPDASISNYGRTFCFPTERLLHAKMSFPPYVQLMDSGGTFAPVGCFPVPQAVLPKQGMHRTIFRDGTFRRSGSQLGGPLRDQVGIMSARSTHKDSAVLGPFTVAEYKPGTYLLLRRNPNYWKHDSNGKQLPYLGTLRLDIQQNRELELLRFRRGELDIVNKLDPEMYDRLSAEVPHSVVDAGPSLDWEVVFFNQVASAPLPEYKRRWFQSDEFRRAISDAINREDICRVVYRGHARPAAGPVSVSRPLLVECRFEAACLLNERSRDTTSA